MSFHDGFKGSMPTVVQRRNEEAVDLVNMGLPLLGEALALANLLRHPKEADAWVAYGAILLHQGKYRKLSRRLNMLKTSVFQRTPALAYLAAKACIGLGRQDEAARWTRMAQWHPKFRPVLENDPALSGYLEEPTTATIRFPRPR